MSAAPPDVTHDSFYGGRLTLAQPARGHRSGTDAVLLAAAVPRDFAGLACDVGAGVGVAGLGIALACPAARVRLVERDPLAAALAAENIERNAFSDRCTVVARDLFAADPADADLVVTNPPFWQAGQVRASPHEGRSAAHVLDAGVTLTRWLQACADGLAPGGRLIVVHAPSALPEIVAVLARRLGALTILSVHPRASTAASRVLVRAAKGSRAPLAIAAPLTLHETDGRFTATADALHRGAVALDW